MMSKTLILQELKCSIREFFFIFINEFLIMNDSLHIVYIYKLNHNFLNEATGLKANSTSMTLSLFF